MENEFCGDPDELWHQKHSLPYKGSPVAGCPEPGDPGEFYLRLESWSNKHYVPSTKEKELVEFVRLGNYLFGDAHRTLFTTRNGRT